MTFGIYIGVAIVAFLVGLILFLDKKAGADIRSSIYKQLQVSVELSRGDVSARKDSIIRLDTLLGKSLEYAGVKGETVGECLKNARHLFDRRKYDEIWRAHKVRNKLVHEQFEISSGETQHIVSVLSSAIRKLLK